MKSIKALKYLLVLLTIFTASSLFGQEVDIPDSHPNYGYYQYRNKFYNEDAKLGWAKNRIKEELNRGLSAVPLDNGKVYISWRLLKKDPDNISFNIYRDSQNSSNEKLNNQPIQNSTNFVDKTVSLDSKNSWWVVPVIEGEEKKDSHKVTLAANPAKKQYRSIKLKKDISKKGIHKIGIGDVNGDGSYDFVIKRPQGEIDPGYAGKSSTSFKVEAYDGKTGEFLWRRDLGWNIVQGTWYSPMIVYDFNGDGKAEVALKTAPQADSFEDSYANEEGRIIKGPEYISVFDGETGKTIDKKKWIPRGDPSDWGDKVGNRMNRNMMGVAYLDGKTPSILVLRGIYGLQKIHAWHLKDGELQRAWRWTNQKAGWRYQGQSGHNIDIGDIDEDAKDEILYGSIAIDNDGKTLWSTGYGHTDEFYLTDADPQRPGMEIWYSYEDPHPANGVNLWDAKNGQMIFGTDRPVADDKVDQAFVADIDPRYPGMEIWAKQGHFYTVKGKQIKGNTPPTSGEATLVWWDGDPLREFLSENEVFKWQGPEINKNIEGRFKMTADLFGDWREEIVTCLENEIRIYTTTVESSQREVTLMQDPVYRKDVALNAQGYYQVPMTGFFLGSIGK